MIKKIINSNVNLLIISLLMLVFCSPIIINYSPYSLQIKKLNIIISKINQCNLSLTQSVQDKSIDSDMAKNLLTSGIVKLDDINQEISSLPSMKQNELLKTKVMDALNYNTSLYEITLSLLKTSDLNSLSIKFPEYSNSLKLVEDSSNTLNILGLEPSFPIESKVFFENSSNYVTTVLKITREKDIKYEQNKYFSQGLNECLSLLDNIDEDLKPALAKIKEDGRSLEVLISDLKNKQSSLSSIKNKSYALTIPEEGSTIFKQFQDVLSTYEIYLNALKYSLITETSSSSSERIDENYNESFDKYDSYLVNVQDFKKELDIFNKNCI